MVVGLKISESIEIKHIIQSKSFFYLSYNFNRSCLSTFNGVQSKRNHHHHHHHHQQQQPQQQQQQQQQQEQQQQKTENERCQNSCLIFLKLFLLIYILYFKLYKYSINITCDTYKNYLVCISRIDFIEICQLFPKHGSKGAER